MPPKNKKRPRFSNAKAFFMVGGENQRESMDVCCQPIGEARPPLYVCPSAGLSRRRLLGFFSISPARRAG
jgi:hypothetical protein